MKFTLHFRALVSCFPLTASSASLCMEGCGKRLEGWEGGRGLCLLLCLWLKVISQLSLLLGKQQRMHEQPGLLKRRQKESVVFSTAAPAVSAHHGWGGWVEAGPESPFPW